MGEIDRFRSAVIERCFDDIIADISGLSDRRQMFHHLLQRRYLVQRSLCLHVFPIYHKFMLVANRPFSDKRQRRSGLYISDDYLTVEIKSCFPTLVFCMKVRRSMIVEIHPNYYPEEYRDGWHFKFSLKNYRVRHGIYHDIPRAS